MTKQTLHNCGKCGLCLNICPVYQQLKEEQASPRARLQLIKKHKNKNLESSPYLKEIMSKCLMCGSCAAMCPSGIDHYSAFMDMRKKMMADHGETPAIKSLIYLLSKEYRLRFGTGIARSGQKILPGFLAKKYKLGNIPLAHFPRLNPKPFRSQVASILKPSGRTIGRVAYFTGCATNYLFDDTGLSTVGILTHMGYEVVIPEKQTCCAVPLMFHGAGDKAQHNVDININALIDVNADHIIVDCSTCAEALTYLYPSISENSEKNHAAAVRIAQKTINIMTFIDEHFDQLRFDAEPLKKETVTYHAPCHSKNRFQSHINAINLIQKLPSVIFKKTMDAEECCGGGGTFFYEFPEISKKMMDQKQKNAHEVQAEKWLTDCPVCRLNLSGSLPKNDPMVVTHPVTLIHKTLKRT